MEEKYTKLLEQDEAPTIVELYSVNAFHEASIAGLGFWDFLEKISIWFKLKPVREQLSRVYTVEALPGRFRLSLKETLAARVTELLKLQEITLPFSVMPAVKQLREQCYTVLKVIFNARNDQHLAELIQHREQRLPFKPNFVHDAPLSSPCRQLLDDLVKWRQTKDPMEKRSQLNVIQRYCIDSLREIAGELKKPVEATEIKQFNTLDERRLYRHLSFILSVKHLVVDGTTKLINERDQAEDLRKNVRVFEGKEREEHRLLAYQNTFRSLKCIGKGDDAKFVVEPGVTLEHIAHHRHLGAGLLVIDNEGGVFICSTIEDADNNNFVFHSSLARETFFAGRIEINSHGEIDFLDNYSGHFLHTEKNFENVCQYLAELRLRFSPRAMAQITAQRYLPTGEAFIKYCHEKELPAALLWDVNDQLMDLLDGEDREECKEEILANARKDPRWQPEWETLGLIDQPNYTSRRTEHRLIANPANLKQFFAARQNSFGTRTNNIPAQEDPDSGVMMALEPEVKLEVCQAELEAIRIRILQKDRLKDANLTLVFYTRKGEPKENEILPGNLYCYAHNDQQFNIMVRLNKDTIYQDVVKYDALPNKDYDNYTRDHMKEAIADPDNNKHKITQTHVRWVKDTVLKLKDYENILIIPAPLVHPSPTVPQADPMTVVSLGLAKHPNALRAFHDERLHHLEVQPSNPMLQKHNLFYGEKCRTDFDPDTNNHGKTTPNRHRITLHSSGTQSMLEKSCLADVPKDKGPNI